MQDLRTEDPAKIGEYAVLGRLGHGAMGRVFLARSPGGRLLAVKVVRPELADDPGFRSRFLQEVASMRAVGGFWTAAVVDADPDGLWLATEYVPGPTLLAAVSSHGPFPVPALRGLVAGLAEALRAIHGAGLVHRDLKPANVLLAADGPRVIDFGIAKALSGVGLTATGMFVGTPGFLSPKQIEGRDATPASDVFALGAVLVFAATGAGPFGSGDAAALMYRAVHAAPSLDGVPASLRPLAARCLDRAPEARPSPAELLAEVGTPDGADWLPAHVRAMVAEQETELNRPAPRPPTRPYTKAGPPLPFGGRSATRADAGAASVGGGTPVADAAAEPGGAAGGAGAGGAAQVGAGSGAAGPAPGAAAGSGDAAGSGGDASAGAAGGAGAGGAARVGAGSGAAGPVPGAAAGFGDDAAIGGEASAGAGRAAQAGIGSGAARPVPGAAVAPGAPAGADGTSGQAGAGIASPGAVAPGGPWAVGGRAAEPAPGGAGGAGAGGPVVAGGVPPPGAVPSGSRAVFRVSRVSALVLAALTSIGAIVSLSISQGASARQDGGGALLFFVVFVLLVVPAVRLWWILVRPRRSLEVSGDGLTVGTGSRVRVLAWHQLARVRVVENGRRPWLVVWPHEPSQVDLGAAYAGGYKVFPVGHERRKSERQRETRELRAALGWYGRAVYDPSP